jgi:hypothetical protein
MISAFNHEIYDRYGLLNLPRKFGYPMQIDIQSLTHLKNLITLNDGKFPLYISCNAHNDEYVLLGQLYFDFDGHGFYTIEDARADVKKLSEYFESQKVDFLIDMTGRGFRILLKVKPDIMKISDADGIMKGYTKHIKEGFNLKTLDLKVAEPKRILRPPLTTYVFTEGKGRDILSKDNVVITKKHILPLDLDTLFNSNMNELIHMSEDLQIHVMSVSPIRVTIDEIAEYKEKHEYVKSDIRDDDIDFMEVSNDYFLQLLDDVFRDTDKSGHDNGPDKQLIKRLLTTHPNHNDRFLACVKAKESSYHLNYNSAVSFFAKLSSVAKWDNRNLEIQAHQIRSIYEKGYGVKLK